VSSADPIVVRGPADRSTFALTYDDGPEWPGTDQLLGLLATRGVQATFFCVGEQVENHPDLARELVKAGHEIGGHTMRHLDHYVQADRACSDMIEGAATIAGRVVADLAPGAIVLLHDAQRYAHERDDCTPTIEASELVLDEASAVASKR
jgi:peptidoglycan/xylan/chitin deacetylase (PgdA/CDA1 family)